MSSGTTTTGSGSNYRMSSALMAKTLRPRSADLQMGLVDILGHGYHSLRSVHAY